MAVCGQTFRVLNALRKVAPDIEVRYSIQKQHQWESFLRKMLGDRSVRRVCMSHRFIDAEKTQLMEKNNVDFYCWTVDDPADAERLVSQGANGIISNNLGLLTALREGS